MGAHFRVSLLPLWLLWLSSCCHCQQLRGDYYQTLGVEPTATEREIKQAFRQQALKYHPDKSRDAKTEHRFLKITEAYKVLSSPDKRRQYDAVGHEAFMSNEATPDPENDLRTNLHFSFPDIFFEIDGDESYFHWRFSHDQLFEIPDFRLYFEEADFEDDPFY